MEKMRQDKPDNLALGIDPYITIEVMYAYIKQPEAATHPSYAGNI
jgi:hypothetical protein